MFYVCQGSCLCSNVNNSGKVIYCFGDLVPRNTKLVPEENNTKQKQSHKDLLVAQIGIWVFGLLALLIVLLLIRKSITSLRKHIEKVTDRLPVYHDEDEMMSQGSGPGSPTLQHKDTTLESMVGHEEYLNLLHKENGMELNQAEHRIPEMGSTSGRIKTPAVGRRGYKQ